MKRAILKECLRVATRKNPTHPEFGRSHHFCFVIQNNKIVEWGTNRPGNAQAMFGFLPARHKLHAEVSAYQRAKGLLEKDERFSVVNIRLNKQNEVRLSAPCECCSRFLEAVGCSKTWFTTNNGWATTI